MLSQAPFKYSNPFFVKTKDRDWTLYAQYEGEMQMWIDGFQYAIKST